jgi:hypothetical protein
MCKEDNEVYVHNEFVPDSEEDYSHGLAHVKGSWFGNGEIVTIGGRYGNKYAIVRN